MTEDHPAEKAPDQPDVVEFLSSGRTKFVIDGEVYMLRLPRVGEYRKFREDIIDAEKGEKSSGGMSTGLDALTAWVQSMFDKLSDREFTLDPDMWPSWLVGGQIQARLLIHWRDIPLGPGSQ